jgi:hypothetical protein
MEHFKHRHWRIDQTINNGRYLRQYLNCKHSHFFLRPVPDEDISNIKVVQYHLIYLNIMSKGGGWGLSLLLQTRV